MGLKLGHDIKVRVGENKKNIRPLSTYLFDVEAGEKWPEEAVVEAAAGGVLPCLWSWPLLSFEAGLQKVDT